MHTSPTICRVGRVPSREAFRGSVITCSRNNERLILLSWLATPFPLSPFLSFVPAESAQSVATYRPFVVSLSQSFCEHESFDCPTFCTVFMCSAPLYISPTRCLDEHSVVFRGRQYRFVSYAVSSTLFNPNREIWICETNRWGVGSRFTEVLYPRPSVFEDRWSPLVDKWGPCNFDLLFLS